MHNRRAKPYFSAELHKKKARMVPLYTCNDFIRGYKESEKIDYIELPSLVIAQFAIRMPDDSMAPEYQEDDLLFISSFSRSMRAAHLIVINECEDLDCNVRFVNEYKYLKDLEVFAYNRPSYWVEKDYVKSLGQVVWRQREY